MYIWRLICRLSTASKKGWMSRALHSSWALSKQNRFKFLDIASSTYVVAVITQKVLCWILRSMWFGSRFQRMKKCVCVCVFVCVSVCVCVCVLIDVTFVKHRWILELSRKDITFIILYLYVNYNFKHFNLTFSEKLQMLLHLIQCFLRRIL